MSDSTNLSELDSETRSINVLSTTNLDENEDTNRNRRKIRGGKRKFSKSDSENETANFTCKHCGKAFKFSEFCQVI